jgi:hypothetical protein
MIVLLSDVGLSIIESGPVGISNLQFVLAVAPEDA